MNCQREIFHKLTSGQRESISTVWTLYVKLTLSPTSAEGFARTKVVDRCRLPAGGNFGSCPTLLIQRFTSGDKKSRLPCRKGNAAINASHHKFPSSMRGQLTRILTYGKQVRR